MWIASSQENQSCHATSLWTNLVTQPSSLTLPTSPSLRRPNAGFNELVAKGFIPAEPWGQGEHHVPDQSKRVFNPDAEETIFVPSLAVACGVHCFGVSLPV